MVDAACHCGAVRLSAPAPSEVTECNCSICRRLGARWAYYTREQVKLPKAGSTQPYVWGERMLAFHRCKACGCVTHWQSLDGAQTRMAINARTMDGLDWDVIRVRPFDGAETWRFLDEEPASDGARAGGAESNAVTADEAPPDAWTEGP